MYFKRKELEKFRSFKGPLIDVRSPSEYYKGHMPNSINIPLFDNDERSIIGKIYKQKGREKAWTQQKRDGKEPKLMTASDYCEKRTVARHYRRQVCKIFFATSDRRDKRIRLGHTALLDWSVFSWIGTIS